MRTARPISRRRRRWTDVRSSSARRSRADCTTAVSRIDSRPGGRRSAGTSTSSSTRRWSASPASVTPTATSTTSQSAPLAGVFAVDLVSPVTFPDLAAWGMPSGEFSGSTPVAGGELVSECVDEARNVRVHRGVALRRAGRRPDGPRRRRPRSSSPWSTTCSSDSCPTSSTPSPRTNESPIRRSGEVVSQGLTRIFPRRLVDTDLPQMWVPQPDAGSGVWQTASTLLPSGSRTKAPK